MNEKEFIKQKKALTAKLDAFKKEIDTEYTAILNNYLDENSPVEKLKVYELEPGKRPYRKGFKRFVVYSRDVQFFSGHPIISAGGWWLNENHVPTKWDQLTVANISNPTVLVLSSDQTALPHPDADK